MLRRLTLLISFAVLGSALLRASPMPPELNRALMLFRAEGARGWAFTQTTESGGQSLVEHFDPTKPESARWTLLQKNGVVPSETDLKEFQERLSRRAGGSTAPSVKDQIDPASCELVQTDETRASYRFHLRAGGPDDSSAVHMTATFTLHKPTATIEQVELASFEPFSPMFMVRIREAKTTMTYSLPDNGRPSLLLKITLDIRGRALWFKSLDEDMTVTYSNHEYTVQKRTGSADENAARAQEPAAATLDR